MATGISLCIGNLGRVQAQEVQKVLGGRGFSGTMVAALLDINELNLRGISTLAIREDPGIVLVRVEQFFASRSVDLRSFQKAKNPRQFLIDAGMLEG